MLLAGSPVEQAGFGLHPERSWARREHSESFSFVSCVFSRRKESFQE